MLTFQLFKLFLRLLFLFPYTWRKRFYLGLSSLVARFDAKHRKVARQNLEFAYDGTLNDAEIERITKGCYNHMALTFAQIIENYHFDFDRLKERVRFDNVAVVEKALEEKRPIIFLTAHYGNWELAGIAISNLLTPLTVIYQKLNNPHFDRFLYESRLAIGMESVEKSGAARALARLLKNGGAVALLTDQKTRKRDGIRVNFFGKAVYHPATPAFLARKYGAAIIPVYTVTEDHEHYTVYFENPIEVPHTDDEAADILTISKEQIARHEAAIRRHPELWFWCHRRWKTTYPEIYR